MGVVADKPMPQRTKIFAPLFLKAAACFLADSAQGLHLRQTRACT
jgi:hypothetical protein